MEVEIYLGRGRALGWRKYGDRTKRTLKLKTEEANHTLIIGGSGFGKTTVMRGMAEAIWTAYTEKGIYPLIFIFERKIDVSKAEKIREIYYTETQKYSKAECMKKYGKQTWKYIEWYVQQMKKYPLYYGSTGDFAMGMPNVLGKFTKMGSNTILGYFGLEPKAFPVTRFVFRPRRPLNHIKADNGWKTEVVDAKIKYSSINYAFLENLTNVGSGTLYGERLKRIWDIERIRDPQKVLEVALKYETDPENPSRTYLRIEETMDRLVKDKLFSPEESFFKHITPKRINIIDFSQNSNLTYEEENLIFKMIVDWAIEVAFRYKIPVFFFVDEIQHFIMNNYGKAAIVKIYREGRSLGINLFGATQFLSGLDKVVIDGAMHIAIVGKVVREADAKLIVNMVPGLDKDDIMLEECNSIDEYLKIKQENKFRGYFIYDKQFCERIAYRHPQSL